jgi:formate/nitrite transporter FocA (FNT family)
MSYATQGRNYQGNQAAKSPETSTQSLVAGAKNVSEGYVKDYPVSTTMLAMGAGALVGLLIARAMLQREEVERERNYFAKLGSQLASSLGNVVPESMQWKR